jgi:hypothetical protein
LFGFVAPQLFCEARQKRHRAAQGLLTLLTAGFAGKIAFEMATGQTVFVDSANAGFTPLPGVHVVGAMVGLFVWAVRRRGVDGDFQGSYPCS